MLELELHAELARIGFAECPGETQHLRIRLRRWNKLDED